MAPAANRGQRGFWKYVSTPIASARMTAPMRYSSGSGPAPAYVGLFRIMSATSPDSSSRNAYV